MRHDLASYALYIALGGALIFAVMAVAGFVEPEGSNFVQVYFTIGVLLAIALLIILDRSRTKGGPGAQ